jgi:hypothetical protein
VRDVQKVRLVHRFQHHQHRTLEDFVLVRGYPERASLVRRASLGDMHSTHRRCHVRAGFGAVEEVLEVGLQVDLIFVRGLSVHADGSVSACPSMSCEHPFDVDVMRQCRERHVRPIPGEFRDPLLFRGHVFGSRCTRHVSLQQVHKMASPSLPRVPRVVPLDQRYCETLRLLASLFAALRFLRLAIPPFRPSFVPVGLGRGPRISLELLSRVSSRHCDGDGKVSQVPVKPVRSSAMFLRPRCDQARLWVQV